MIADGLGLGGQVVGIDADAVAADQARGERQEVPLGLRRGEHVAGAQPQAIEDQGELVHQGDVEVALGVLDDLGGFGDLDRGRAVQPGRHDRAVNLDEPRQGRLVRSRDHLGDVAQAMRRIARVDALGRIAEAEVDPGLEARELPQQRAADLLGHTGIDGRFEHHGTARPQHAGDAPAGLAQGLEIRAALLVDRRRHRHHEEVGAGQVGGIGGEGQRRVAKLRGRDLAGVVDPLTQRRDAALGDVEADRAREHARQGDRDRQADIAEADDCNPFRHDTASPRARRLAYEGLGSSGSNDPEACPRSGSSNHQCFEFSVVAAILVVAAISYMGNHPPDPGR